jgi:hypothetical protein
MTPLSSSGRPVRDLVAAADRQRRGRVAFGRLQTTAPWVAGAALIVALGARFLGAPAWSAGAVAGAALVGLLAYWMVLRRDRPTSDAIATAVDTDANLKGELRSAHWFEAQDERDSWAAFHLDRATARASSVDWRALYPSSRSARSWIVTVVLAAGVIATGFRFPARHAAVQTAKIDTNAIGAELPADLQAKLARLMAQLDDAALDQDAKRASLADLKKMMASMDPELQKKLLAALEKKPAGADAQKTSDFAKNDAATPPTKSTDLPDDLKWAQENQAAKAAQAEDRKPGASDQAQPAKGGEQPASATMQAQADQGGKADAATPIVRESAAAEEGKKMMGGGGPMGGDSRPGAGKTDNNVKGAAAALLAVQNLRKELLEASADALGDNVEKEDLRRKTEQGKSSLGFTHVTAQGTVDPSRSAAPPPVPEPRRSLLFHYFIRR